jgi:hypothetical protein
MKYLAGIAFIGGWHLAWNGMTGPVSSLIVGVLCGMLISALADDLAIG